MPSRVVQMRSEHFPRLAELGIPFKDVTDRERRLKLTINQLKCELAGDSARFFVMERGKVAALCRVAELARALPLDDLARDPALAGPAQRLREELRALGRLPEVG